MNANEMFEIIGETPDRYVQDAGNVSKSVTVMQKRSPKRIWLLAALISLMLFMMGSAISALVSMRVEKVKLYSRNGETQAQQETIGTEESHKEDPSPSVEVHEGEKVIFEETRDEFIELGAYYPQEIPDGYAMTFVSDDAPLQNQVIHYENEAGNLLRYWIYVGDPASSIEVYGIEEKLEVQINGLPGILYEQTGDARTLIWVNEKQGYGFVIRADDANVDILAMAESTAEAEPLVPTHSEETLKALEELGDFSPQYLPEGFTELNVQGFPIAEGGGWYSYVRKWYVNKEENSKIYFEYETYKIVTEDGYTDDARTACSFYVPKDQNGGILGEEVEINGLFGIADKCDIAWADPETHKVYHLYSEDVTGEELLKVAQNISN